LSIEVESFSLAVYSKASKDVDVFPVNLLFSAKAYSRELSLQLDVLEKIRIALEEKKLSAFQVANAIRAELCNTNC
jgi:hypothetical protein